MANTNFITITYKVTGSLDNAVQEILETSSNLSYLTMTDYRVTDSKINDDTLCGVQFDFKQANLIHKLFSKLSEKDIEKILGNVSETAPSKKKI